MPTDFVSFRGTNYVADRNAPGVLTPYKGRFNRPPGMTDATVSEILAAIGATQLTPGEKVACETGKVFEPRRLKFIFSTGASISVPIPTRAGLIALGGSLRGILQAGLSGTIACVGLIGEEWKRLDQELRPGTVVPAPGIDVRPTTGLKNPIFSAFIQYESDSGRTFAEGVRMNTNQATNLPFSPYAVVIGTSLGTLLPAGCGGATNTDARRYVIDILTTNLQNPTRKMIVPVADDDAADIRGIGVGLVTNPQTLCLRYYGESDNRFSRFFP